MRLAGFVEPFFLPIVMLNEGFQGNGQEWSYADILGKERNLERGSDARKGAVQYRRELYLSSSWTCCESPP